MNRTCGCTHARPISTLTSPTEQVLFISIRETARPTGNWWEGLCSESLQSTTSVLQLLSLKPKWSQNTAASFAFSNASHLQRSCSASCNKTTCLNNLNVYNTFYLFKFVIYLATLSLDCTTHHQFAIHQNVNIVWQAVMKKMLQYSDTSANEVNSFRNHIR